MDNSGSYYILPRYKRSKKWWECVGHPKRINIRKNHHYQIGWYLLRSGKRTWKAGNQAQRRDIEKRRRNCSVKNWQWRSSSKSHIVRRKFKKGKGRSSCCFGQTKGWWWWTSSCFCQSVSRLSIYFGQKDCGRWYCSPCSCEAVIRRCCCSSCACLKVIRRSCCFG